MTSRCGPLQLNMRFGSIIECRIASLALAGRAQSRYSYRTEYWLTSPPPAGVLGVPRRKLIDFDEFGVSLEKCNRTGGWAMKVLRVRKDGHYHHGAKITVIFAIETGDPLLPPHV